MPWTNSQLQRRKRRAVGSKHVLHTHQDTGAWPEPRHPEDDSDDRQLSRFTERGSRFDTGIKFFHGYFVGRESEREERTWKSVTQIEKGHCARDIAAGERETGVEEFWDLVPQELWQTLVSYSVCPLLQVILLRFPIRNFRRSKANRKCVCTRQNSHQAPYCVLFRFPVLCFPTSTRGYFCPGQSYPVSY